MKVLVNGINGRLGPYVVADLEQAGHDPVLFSRRNPPPDRRLGAPHLLAAIHRKRGMI